MNNDIHKLWDSLPAGKKERADRAGDLPMPATIIIGAQPGKTLLITAGVHGCECCSIQAAIELAEELSPEELRGTAVIVHMANFSGFLKRLPGVVAEDGKNLNRVFPGDAEGSVAERLAWHITTLQRRADFYLDLHGGDQHESMHPLVFVPGVAEPAITEAARAVAEVLAVDTRVLSRATSGAYNSAALLGIPSLLLERGGNGRLVRADVDACKRDVRSALAALGILPPENLLPPSARPVQREAVNTIYLESDAEGCWYPCVEPGQVVRQGDLLGELRGWFGEPLQSRHARQDGCVLYLTVPLAVEVGAPLVAYG